MNSERAGQRRNDPLTVRVTACKKHERNSLRAFVDITVEDWGMSMRGISIHARDEKRWCGMPSREFTSPQGKKYVPIIDFIDEDARWRFYNSTLDAFDNFVARQDAGDQGL